MTPTEFDAARTTLGWSKARLAAELDLDVTTLWRYSVNALAIPRTVELAMLYLTAQKGSES